MIVWFYSDRKLENLKVKEKHEKLYEVGGMVPLPLGKSKGLLLWKNLNILCAIERAFQFILNAWPEKKLMFSPEDATVIYRYIIALYMFYRKK